ncbi:MAG: hypothetical protein SGI86_22415 [Deltaproteobacteria bacterium]|nr:hypothetical protein [Deltaproteobacteria bacterium]
MSASVPLSSSVVRLSSQPIVAQKKTNTPAEPNLQIELINGTSAS